MIVPSLRKAGRRAASDSVGRVAAHALVGGDHDRVALALRDRDRHDLVVEDAVLPGLGGLLVRRGREGVLLLAGELGVRAVVVLGQRTHRLLGGLVEEGVVGHRVDERGVAVLEALARLRQQVRRVRHRLHAARHDDLGLTGVDQQVGLRDRVQTREAHLVDGDRRHPERQAAGDAGAAGGVLPGAGQDDLAHDQVVDLVARHPGLLQRPLDGHAAQVGRGQGLQATEQTPDRRACSGDDDGSGHGASSQGSVIPVTIPSGRPGPRARSEPAAEENVTQDRASGPCGATTRRTTMGPWPSTSPPTCSPTSTTSASPCPTSTRRSRSIATPSAW